MFVYITSPTVEKKLKIKKLLKCINVNFKVLKDLIVTNNFFKLNNKNVIIIKKYT